MFLYRPRICIAKQVLNFCQILSPIEILLHQFMRGVGMVVHLNLTNIFSTYEEAVAQQVFTVVRRRHDCLCAYTYAGFSPPFFNTTQRRKCVDTACSHHVSACHAISTR